MGGGKFEVTKRGWILTAIAIPLLAIVVSAAVGLVVNRDKLFSTSTTSSTPTTAPIPPITIQLPPPYLGPNSSPQETTTPEITVGDNGCRDDPDDYAGLATWGPPRNLLRPDSFSELPSFNLDDVSVYGDERFFYNVRDTTAPPTTPWQRDIKIERGKTYLLRLFIHNSADESDKGIAEGTRIRVSLPTCTGHRIASTAFIEALNTEPLQIWDSVHFISDEPFNLAYVPGSAQLCNNHFSCEGAPGEDGEISNDFLTSNGTLIGYDHLDGLFRAGYRYSAWFYFQVQPEFVPVQN